MKEEEATNQPNATAPPPPTNPSSQTNRKRPRSDPDEPIKHDSTKSVPAPAHHVDAYYSPISSSGRPGTPHSFFQESYRVHLPSSLEASSSSSCSPTLGTTTDDDKNDNRNQTVDNPEKEDSSLQVLHQHANGLVLVTAGARIAQALQPPQHSNGSVRMTVQSIEWCQSAAPVANQSASQKRKHQTKLQKQHHKQQKQEKGTQALPKLPPGMVQPTTVLARIGIGPANQDKDDSSSTTMVPLYAGIWGTILEVNSSLTPTVLTQDPLLNGYLAVLLPSSSLGPSTKTSAASPSSDDRHKTPPPQPQEHPTQDNLPKDDSVVGGESTP